MRIYFDEIGEVLVVVGTKANYAPGSLLASDDNGALSIWLRGEQRRIAGPFPWEQLVDQAGSGFLDCPTALAYLNTAFTKKPKSTDDGTDYVTIFEGALV